MSIVSATERAKKNARQQRKREQAQRRRDRDLKSGKVEAVRRAARERMSKIRFGRSDEKYKQDRENARLGMSTSRKNQSDQKREAEKAMDAVRKSTYRKNQSRQEREAEKVKNAKTRRDKRQKESPEEANSRRSKRATPSSPAVDSAEDRNILSENTIKKCKTKALKYLHRTLDTETGMHHSHVCVVCDCFILGTEKLKRLNKLQLRAHEKRLSVDQYMSFHNLKGIPSSLRDHYKVSGFPKMLLSPRSNFEKGKGYSCCESCFTAMKPSLKEKSHRNSPLPMAFLLDRFLLSSLSMIMETYNI